MPFDGAGTKFLKTKFLIGKPSWPKAKFLMDKFPNQIRKTVFFRVEFPNSSKDVFPNLNSTELKSNKKIHVAKGPPESLD